MALVYVLADWPGTCERQAALYFNDRAAVASVPMALRC